MADQLRVIKQEPTYGALDDGTFGRVVRITFRTPAGVLGVIDVPAATYSEETAVAAIRERAEHLDAVQAL